MPCACAQVLAGARVVAINGFVFDELPMEVVLQAAQHASEAGAAIFFDPGPRAWTMAPAQLHAMVRKAHVVLMTQARSSAVTQMRASGSRIQGRERDACCHASDGPRRMPVVRMTYAWSVPALRHVGTSPLWGQVLQGYRLVLGL